MALTCKQASRISLATLGGHADEAEKLRLEEHLVSCAGCGDEHAATLALVGALGSVEPETLTPTARESVRQTLAARAPLARRAPPAPWARRLRLGFAIAGVAGAAAAAVALVGARDFWSRPDAVVAGDVTTAPPAPGDGRGDATYRSAGGGRVRLGGAEVDLARTTEIGWSQGLRRVELRRGGLTVDVEHRPGQRFEVHTMRFTVVVVGTRFTVDLGGVHTERGIVRVQRPDGSLAAQLEAGQTWRADAAAALAPGATPAPPAPTPPVAPAAPRIPEATAETRARATGDPAGHLGDARRALARGDAQAARRLVSPLFHLGREVGVEARILFAESFLIEGRYADAMEGYRVVVRDFPGSSQAENAQFALAQLTSEHGRGEDARAAFQDYLARYPRGRFAREAALRLAQPSSRQR